MKALRRKGETARPAERTRIARDLDAEEARAIMIGAAILAVFLYWIKLILLPFVLAGIVAYICTPLLDWAAKRTRWPRMLFAVALFLVLLAIALTITAFAGQHIMAEARSTVGDLQQMLEKFTAQAIGDHPVELFGISMNAHDIVQSLFERLRGWLGQTDQIAAIAGYSVAVVLGMFLTMVLLFYFLASGDRLARGLFWVVPPHRRGLVARIWARLDPMLMRYFVGVLGVVVYASIAAYLGLGVILGIKHAVLLALLTGILETIPVIGPTAAAIIAGLVALHAATGIANIVEYAIYATVLRLSIDQLVGPVVLGRAAHVHPVLIIFCFLAGGLVLGIPGVILAVPVALIIKSTLATLYGDEAD
jgi:predicted PurR-regulated permease PerM